MSILNAMPGAVAQGLIWGLMAIGVYISYKILDIADLTVDGSFCTGGAVCVTMMVAGCNVWVAMLIAVLAGMLAAVMPAKAAEQMVNVNICDNTHMKIINQE